MPTITAYPQYGITEDMYGFYGFTKYTDYPVSNCLDYAESSNFARLGLTYNNSEKIHIIGVARFDFSELPNDAIITRIVIRIKRQITGSQYCKWNGLEVYDGNLVHHGATIGFYYDNIPSTLETVVADSNSDNLGNWTASEAKTMQLLFFLSHKPGSGDAYMDLYGFTVSIIYADAPTITLGTPSRTKISSVSGYDQATVTFQSDIALQAWEARATLPGANTGHGVGLLVESGTTLAANTDATVIIDDEELTNGDNEYTITVFGQSTEGRWSDG